MTELIDALGPSGGVLIRHKGNDSPKVFPDPSWADDIEATTEQRRWLNKGLDKGRFYTRTTTFIDCLDDKTALHDHDLRGLLAAASQFPDVLDKYRQIEDPDGAGKFKVKALVKQALDRAGYNLKRDAGSGMHGLLEQLALGQELGFVPPEFEADIEAARQVLAGLKGMGWDVWATELYGVNDTYEFAGTTDLIFVNREQKILRLGDWKTGTTDFARGKFPAQVAGYAGMCDLDLFTYRRTRRGEAEGLSIDTEVGWIIHLPLGEGWAEVIPVDLEAGRENLELAKRVREYRSYWARKANWQEPILVVGKDDLTN